MYDVIVAGGSIAGLLCAREIAAGGHTVLVVEEDYEIGTPEHCGGLIGTAALKELKIPYSGHMCRIDTAQIFSPSGKSFELDASRQEVVEISRREMDKQVAYQAQKNGAEISVGTSFQGETDNGARVGGKDIKCRIIVDARGISSLIQSDRAGVMTSAQYEVHADWIQKGRVEVFFDNQRYPGFFAWIIPSAQGTGKVGVAGRAIIPAQTIKKFLAARKKSTIVRKIFAPIWIKGSIRRFVSRNTVSIGDAAGQTKPTTAGGIFSCGMGGILAARSISRYLDTGERRELSGYQAEWNKKFKGEFQRQLVARKILETLDNGSIDRLFDSVTPKIAGEVSQGSDFDFHAGAIIKLLGIKSSLKTAQVIVEGGMRGLLGK